jgi:predicted nucleotidyltransferase
MVDVINLSSAKLMHRKQPDNIQQRLNQAENYLQTLPAVVFAYLFGSLAKGKSTPSSDVDIAVYLKQGIDVAETKIEIIIRLSDILQTDDIDLIILNSANLPLINNIIKYHKLIVDNKPFERHRFESLSMRKYLDFSIKESAMLKRRYLHG